jgi:hypothetical protein
VAFGQGHPEQYAILFTRKIELSPEIDKTVDSMLGAEAFAFLLDGVRECAAAGRSHSTQPIDDATALWVALHGYVSLRTGDTRLSLAARRHRARQPRRPCRAAEIDNSPTVVDRPPTTRNLAKYCKGVVDRHLRSND